VGSRVGLGDMEKWKFSALSELELRPPVVQPVASRYTDYATAALQTSLVRSNKADEGSRGIYHAQER
jgi:hypothetical protein